MAQIRQGVLRLARRLRAERAPGAMSSNQVAVLAHLSRFGASTPGAIAAAEGQQPQSLTRTFQELQLAGLIHRGRSARDGRESVLTITAAGQFGLTHQQLHLHRAELQDVVYDAAAQIRLRLATDRIEAAVC